MNGPYGSDVEFTAFFVAIALVFIVLYAILSAIFGWEEGSYDD
tara:strand:+ start:119 stop:247 length:129 start_codon:yes stop_codon:yes gene_type:complete